MANGPGSVNSGGEGSGSRSLWQQLWSSLSKDVPGRLRSLLAVGAFLVLIAAVWLSLASQSQPRSDEIVWVPAVLMLIGGGWMFVIVAFRLLRKRVAEEVTDKAVEAMSSEVTEKVAKTVTTEIHRGALSDVYREAGILVGVRIGRRTVTCGALEIDPTAGYLPQPSSYHTLVDQEQVRFDSSAGEVRLDRVAELVAKVASRARGTRPDLRIERIGIGIPGFVDPRQGAVEWPHSVHVVEEIGKRLHAGALSSQVFGVTDRRDFEDLCLLDNDVRCATRLLLSRHLDERRRDDSWGNFAALHLGTGVGVGLVLGGRIHYGSHGWAGELGHIDLRPAKGISIGTEQGTFPPMPCTCGTVGYHFEALVNYQGLLELGRFVCPQLALEAENIAGGLDEKWDFQREVWPKLVCSGGNLPPVPLVFHDLIQTEQARKALPMVRAIHIALVGGAIASLASLFDIDRVVLFGSLYQLMQEVEVDRELKDVVADRLKTPLRYDYASVEDDTWRGAALLARDADFNNFLEGHGQRLR